LASSRWWSLCVALALFGTSGAARAEEADSQQTRAQARQYFDRGLKLFNQGDNSGALVEFQQAYELIPHPLVLYNIGLVYVATHRPVAAVDAFDMLLKNPGTLDGQRLATAKEKRAEQLARIGTLDIKTNAEHAQLEIDNLQVADLPLSEPLRVASGECIVGVLAPGYLPERRRLTVRGNSQQSLVFDLQPLDGRLAHLSISANLVDAEVWVDGDVVGKTPLPASLPVPPGKHLIELKREGYRTASKTLELGDGSSGDLRLDLEEDSQALAGSGGTLALEISESGSVVFIDGRSRGVYTAPLRLPPGRHQLRVERGDFMPVEREVVLVSNQQVSVAVQLEPTPEKRTEYTESARAQHTWGWVTLGAGAVIGVGSGAFLLINRSRESKQRDKIDEIAARDECDGLSPDFQSSCRQELNLEIDDLDTILAQNTYGWVGVGVGAAALITGTVLLMTADDPNRYEPSEESDVFSGVRATPTAWIDGRSFGAGLVGRF